jgi:hypothetical protein
MTDFNPGSTDLVATITPIKGEPLTVVYEDTTASRVLVQDSTARAGVEVKPEYIEAITQTVERSRGLIDGGFKISVTVPDLLGGWGLSLERKPRTETRTTTKVVYKK